ncbi:MAG: O-antigen ligase family protein [Chloroflexi bacterium]|nr:O-antigen ligase family protein [Chloroflexota bacterium]
MAAMTAPPRHLSAQWYAANERRRAILLTVVALAASVALGQAVVRIGFAAALAPLAIAIVAGIMWRPKIGLFGIVLMILLFEIDSADPLMLPGRYFNYGLQSTLGLSGFIASPLEMALVLSTSVWLVSGIVRRRLAFRGGDLGWPVLLFFLAIVLGVLRGALEGGDMYVAFWEARSLLLLGVAYLLGANLIRTRQDVAVLLGICFLGTALYALEGAWRDVALIRTGALDIPVEYFYNHEVVIYLSVILLQVLVAWVVRGPLWIRLLGLAVSPIVVYTMLATQRRAGYIALFVGFVAISIPWVIRHRKALLLIFVPGILVTAIYLPVFWNNTGMLGQPARAVRSLSEPDERDASSNAYRDLEKINVQETIRANPLFGVGFGRQFTFYVPLPDLSWWPFWHYEPHHNILWIWLKTGAFGFIVFWVVMLGALTLAVDRAVRFDDPILQSFAYVTIATVSITLVFCYVDLGLTNGRVTVFLGVLLGTLSVLDRVEMPAVTRTTSAETRAAGRPWAASRGRAA